MKDIFANALLLVYKLLVIANHDVTLGEMIHVVFKKKAYIDKLYAIHNNKSYTSKKKTPQLENKTWSASCGSIEK